MKSGRWIIAAVLVAGLAGSAAFAARSVAPPRVAGPRTTSSAQPVYRFRADGAVGFRCAFDDPHLHRCAARYSEPLATGRHLLRVRAVGRNGAVSTLVTVSVVVRPAPPARPALSAGTPVSVGQGPGVPSAGAGAIWVPNTGDGTVTRVDPATGGVTATIPAVEPAPMETGCPSFAACGYLNASVVEGSDVWVSCDFCGQVVHIDGASNRVVGRTAVAARPGGLAAGGGFVWAFHTLGSTVTRIDPLSGAASSFSIPGLRGAGIAYALGAVWVLDVSPAAALRLDPASLAVRGRVPLAAFGVRHPFREAWSLAVGNGSLWAANPNYDLVTEIGAGTAAVKRHVRLPRDQPFGIALSGGDVWVAARTGIVRLDARSGAVLGELVLPAAGSGYTGVAAGFGAAWVTNYDRNTLTRVAPR